jgi:hypothetical protein
VRREDGMPKSGKEDCIMNISVVKNYEPQNETNGKKLYVIIIWA